MALPDNRSRVQMPQFVHLYPASAIFQLPLPLRRGTDACFLYPVPRLRCFSAFSPTSAGYKCLFFLFCTPLALFFSFRSILLYLQNPVASCLTCFALLILQVSRHEAAEKGNACFAGASFSLERDKFNFNFISNNLEIIH